jgi:hypothetical protein
MIRRLFFCITLVVGSICPCHARAEDKDKEEKVQVSEKEFNRFLFALFLDPTQAKADEIAKLILSFTSQTPKSNVMLGKEEMKWFGMTKDADKKDKRPLLLFAAYAGANTQAQIATGVKRNDRYAGLLGVFQVYRALREKDAKFKVPALDELLKLHKDSKLAAHLAELDRKDKKVEN